MFALFAINAPHRTGYGKRQRICYPYCVGLIGLWTNDVKTADDFRCTPIHSSFSISDAQAIAAEFREGKEIGMLGECQWQYLPEVSRPA
jgi:hypothetical protein